VRGSWPLHVVGKRAGRGVVASTTSTGQPGELGMLVDHVSGRKFLVDTGSVYSILPHQSTEPAMGPAIMTADRTPISCWGQQEMTIVTAGHSFKFVFLLADVAFAIVGANFLSFYDLAVDLKRMRLIRDSRFFIPLAAPPCGARLAAIGVVAADSTCRRAWSSPSLPTVEAPCSTPSSSSSSLAAARASQHVGAANTVAIPVAPRLAADVLKEFPEVVNKSKVLPAVRHNVQHVIELTTQRPVSSRYRRLDAGKLQTARMEFASMEKQGIVRRSNSSWASPLHMVEKADGTWRPCGDYRRLNLVTKPDLYPSPHLEDMSARLAGKRVFSKIDLRKGYYQVPVAASDVQKTAVITPFGLFEFLRMPFGLRNAGQTFQRFMDELFGELSYVFVYMDDMLVASVDHVEHVQQLRHVLETLKKQGLVINAEKCVFAASTVEFLGHQVDQEGIRPLAARVAALQEYPAPAVKSELLTYLGMLNFYRKFLPQAASILKPLTDATRGESGKHVALDWTADMRRHFLLQRSCWLELPCWCTLWRVLSCH
jgi:hypothetical protein